MLGIDGKSVSKIAREDLAHMCIGARGTSTTLVIRKRTTRKELTVTLTRR